MEEEKINGQVGGEVRQEPRWRRGEGEIPQGRELID